MEAGIFPDLNFSHAADPAEYFKAFCLNPADDHCDLGVCPNTDVTGIGQQVSIYITTFSYAIVLVYIPRLHRTMLYAHLSVLYSLFIAAVVSMSKGELTNADGIFVVVAASSPSSLHLWFLTIRSFWNTSVFPIQPADKSVPAHKSLVIQLTRALALLSLIFEIILIFLILTPTKRIQFSQPACNREYGKALWYNVAWVAPVAVQSGFILGMVTVASILARFCISRKAYEAPARILRPLGKGTGEKPTTKPKDNIDMISWTEQVLWECWPHFMNRTLFVCLITTAQLSALPSLMYVVDIKGCLSVVLVFAGLVAEKPRKGSNVRKIYAIRVV
ncbi:hypothetical protein H1R20_g831, partial [Candolleomyces eurysporus]